MLRIWLKTWIVRAGISGWIPRRVVGFAIRALGLRHV